MDIDWLICHQYESVNLILSLFNAISHHKFAASMQQWTKSVILVHTNSMHDNKKHLRETQKKCYRICCMMHSKVNYIALHHSPGSSFGNSQKSYLLFLLEIPSTHSAASKVPQLNVSSYSHLYKWYAAALTSDVTPAVSEERNSTTAIIITHQIHTKHKTANTRWQLTDSEAGTVQEKL